VEVFAPRDEFQNCGRQQDECEANHEGDDARCKHLRGEQVPNDPLNVRSCQHETDVAVSSEIPLAAVTR